MVFIIIYFSFIIFVSKVYLGGYHKGTVPKLQFPKCPLEEKIQM